MKIEPQQMSRRRLSQKQKPSTENPVTKNPSTEHSSTPMPKTPVSEGVKRSSGSYELVFSAALMGLIGFGLDTLFGIRPVLTIVLAVLGATGAVASIYFRYREAMRRETRQR